MGPAIWGVLFVGGVVFVFSRTPPSIVSLPKKNHPQGNVSLLRGVGWDGWAFFLRVGINYHDEHGEPHCMLF